MKYFVLIIILFSSLISHASYEETLFDLATLSDLNDQADALWNQLVQETGSADNAAASLKAKTDSRFKNLHENLLQMIESSQFQNSYVQILLASTEEAWLKSIPYTKFTGKKWSPLLLMAARNISVIAAKRMHKVLENAKARPPVTDRYVATLLSCSMSESLCGYDPAVHTKEMLRWSRIYLYSTKIALGDFQNNPTSICQWPDKEWADAALNSLVRSWLGSTGINQLKRDIQQNCQIGRAHV